MVTEWEFECIRARAEVDRLEAELARVRAERDRLAEELYDDYYRDEAILRVLSPMVDGHHPNAALAAALVEHDRACAAKQAKS